MFAIIVNHIRFFPNAFVLITGGTFLWVSFAEAFFAIAGFVFAYSNKRKNNPFIQTVKKAWSRMFGLYLWSFFLTILFTLLGNLLPKGQVQNGLWVLNENNWVELLTKAL